MRRTPTPTRSTAAASSTHSTRCRGRLFSADGGRRLAVLSGELRALRRRSGQPLLDLVHDVERTLGLDVEVAAGVRPGGRTNLDRFLDVVTEFAASGEAPTLPAFLAYLDAAETAERGLSPGEVEVVGDQVQVLTVYGAKDSSGTPKFVAGLVDGVFPAGHATDCAWLGRPGACPTCCAATSPHYRLQPRRCARPAGGT